MNGASLCILAVSPHLVRRAAGGDAIRTTNLITRLRERGHQVTLWVAEGSSAPPTPDADLALLHDRRFAARERVGMPAKLRALASATPEKT